MFLPVIRFGNVVVKGKVVISSGIFCRITVLVFTLEFSRDGSAGTETGL